MGNGPGGSASTRRCSTGIPRLQGGFVWEWREHGIAIGRGDTEYFGYGGDFGEHVHDGTFVADGLVAPDGAPRPALADLKKVYEPIRISIDADATTAQIRNRHDVIDLRDFTFEWAVVEDEHVRAAGELVVENISPERNANLPSGEGTGRMEGEQTATPCSRCARSSRMTPDGRPQLTRSHGDRSSRPPSQPISHLGGTAPGEEEAHSVAGIDFTARGALRSIGGAVPIVGPSLLLWRAPTDNDLGSFEGQRPDATVWEEAGLEHLHTRTVSVVSDGTRTMCANVSRQQPPPAESTRTSSGPRRPRGADLDFSVTPIGGWRECDSWPRVGIEFELPSDFDEVIWMGDGPDQSYPPDTGQGQRAGWWRSNVAALSTDYLRPQENGARTCRSFLTICDGRHEVTIRGNFSFTISRNTRSAVAQAEHDHELAADGPPVHLIIDFAQRGVGTAACGPGVLAKHELTPPRDVHGDIRLEVRTIAASGTDR